MSGESDRARLPTISRRGQTDFRRRIISRLRIWIARRVSGEGRPISASSRVSISSPKWSRIEKVAVHDPVEERMGEIVRPALAQTSPFVAEPLPDGIEEFSLLLLKGDQIVGAEDDAHLLGDETAVGVLMEMLENDVEIIAVVLELRPLVRVQDVFEDQGVEAEESHLFEQLDVLEAVDVDPGDCLPGPGAASAPPGYGSPFR